jgi:hypothetical protein
MAPRVRSYSLENRTQRLRLPVRRKSYSVQIAVAASDPARLS